MVMGGEYCWCWLAPLVIDERILHEITSLSLGTTQIRMCAAGSVWARQVNATVFTNEESGMAIAGA